MSYYNLLLLAKLEKQQRELAAIVVQRQCIRFNDEHPFFQHCPSCRSTDPVVS
jgi:hypothetical protein